MILRVAGTVVVLRAGIPSAAFLCRESMSSPSQAQRTLCTHSCTRLPCTTCLRGLARTFATPQDLHKLSRTLPCTAHKPVPKSHHCPGASTWSKLSTCLNPQQRGEPGTAAGRRELLESRALTPPGQNTQQPNLSLSYLNEAWGGLIN